MTRHVPHKPHPPKPEMARLRNGVRVLALPLPHALTANVSVFVRSGSAHEPRRLSGISHVIEHMVFKGSATRDAKRINLDAEMLGAEVNAHTDKDHCAFHMRGHPADVLAFVRMLADITLHATFPEHEIASERQVLLQEYAEDEDDPMSIAFRLFDKACWGTHAAAMPVIGSRRLIEGFTREDLWAHRKQHYNGENIVVAAAGPINVDAFMAEVERGFAEVDRGQPQLLSAPDYHGGVRSRSQAGSSQTHAVMGFAIPGQQARDATAELGAIVLGEGMSSPLMQRLREQRGLVYYAACTADVMDSFGQFVIEASMAPEHLQDFIRETSALLLAQASSRHPEELARARKQWAVRQLRLFERPHRWLEQAALDVFVLGRPRSQPRWARRVASITAEQLRVCFERLLAQPVTLALSGHVPRGSSRLSLPLTLHDQATR